MLLIESQNFYCLQPGVLLDYSDWHQQESSTEVGYDLKTVSLWIVNSTFILFASNFNLF